MPRTKEAKPAAIVKCPFCEHTGSARGLYSHVRLMHPGKEKSISTRSKLVNPHAIGNTNKGKSNGLSLDEFGNLVVTTALVGLIAHIVEEFKKTQSRILVQKRVIEKLQENSRVRPINP